MRDHDREIVELPRILSAAAGYAASDVGKEVVLHLPVLTEPAAVARAHDEVGEAAAVLDAGEDLPLEGVADIRPHLEEARAQGAVLFPEALLAVRRALEAFARLSAYLAPRSEACPVLGRIASGIGDRRKLAAELRRCIDDDAQVTDKASPELARLRRDLRRARERAEHTVRELSTGPFAETVRDLSTIQHNDRYVLPVVLSRRSRVGGIAHHYSRSGGTVFMEPDALVPLNNELQELRDAEAEEVARILGSLTDAVREEGDGIVSDLILYARVDCARARARYARRLGHTRPRRDDAGQLHLVAGRHPLLGAEAVPVEIRLRDGKRVLVLSGPNTGGKTVALKLLALSAFMSQAGLFVPCAEGTALPVFDGIYCDIGDEQSIDGALSTFSAHVANVKEILSLAGPRSLVVIDEPGTGTDPEEGGALAEAIVKHLVGAGAIVAVASHFGSLKALALADPSVENACVELDRTSGRPTFVVHYGVTGASEGLRMARSLGLPSSLVDEAEAILARDPGGREFRERMAELSRQKIEVTMLRSELERELQEARAAGEEYRERGTELGRREKGLRKEVSAEVERFVAEKRSEFELLVKKLRESAASGEAVREGKREIESMTRAGSEIAKPRLSPERREPPPSLAIGDRVRNGTLVGTVERLDLSKGRAWIQTGSVHMEVPIEGIERIEGAKPPVPVVTRAGGGAASVRCDLRGLRYADAEGALTRFLDEAMLSGAHEVLVIHGKGTGALKEMTRALLSSHPAVRESREAPLELGGAGCTIVSL